MKLLVNGCIKIDKQEEIETLCSIIQTAFDTDELDDTEEKFAGDLLDKLNYLYLCFL